MTSICSCKSNGNLDNIQGNLKENIDVFDKKDSYSNNKSDERNFNNYEKSLNNTDKEKDEKDFYNNLDSGNIEEKGNINNLFGRSNLDND